MRVPTDTTFKVARATAILQGFRAGASFEADSVQLKGENLVLDGSTGELLGEWAVTQGGKPLEVPWRALANAPILEVETLNVSAEGIDLPVGLTLATVEIRGEKLEIFTNERRVNGKKLTIVATVKEFDLLRFAASKTPKAANLVGMKLASGEMVIEAEIAVFKKLTGSAICAVDIVNKSQLHLRILKATVGHLNPKAIVDSLMKGVNPVFDAADLPFTLEIDKVTLANGEMAIHCRVPLPAALK